MEDNIIMPPNEDVQDPLQLQQIMEELNSMSMTIKDLINRTINQEREQTNRMAIMQEKI
jgi:hypothetical protein